MRGLILISSIDGSAVRFIELTALLLICNKFRMATNFIDFAALASIDDVKKSHFVVCASDRIVM